MKQKTQKFMRIFKRKIGHFRLWLSDNIDIFSSRNMDINNIESVCITLGPYRNLTTLTASVLFLHPNCKVLNYAARRVYGRKK